MSDDIKVGDRFLVEVEVVRTHETGADCTAQGGEKGATILTWDEIAAAKRLPRALKVGDRVRDIDVAGVAVILALHGERAWVTPADDDGDEGWITHLSDLRLAEEAR